MYQKKFKKKKQELRNSIAGRFLHQFQLLLGKRTVTKVTTSRRVLGHVVLQVLVQLDRLEKDDLAQRTRKLSARVAVLVDFDLQTLLLV